MGNAAHGLAEAPDFINNSGRIEKGVEMTVVDFNSMLMAGHNCAARTAQQSFFGFNDGIVGRVGIRRIQGAGLQFFPAEQTGTIRSYAWTSDSGQQ